MKIKEDFDLKKLEFYGFERNMYNEGYVYTLYKKELFNFYYILSIFIDDSTREITIDQDIYLGDKAIEYVLSDKDWVYELFNNQYKLPDVLLELIKAGVVE